MTPPGRRLAVVLSSAKGGAIRSAAALFAAAVTVVIVAGFGPAAAATVAPVVGAHASIPATPAPAGGSVSAQAATASTPGQSFAGYWETAADGGVSNFGAVDYGGLAGDPLNKPIVGMAATPGGSGYWLVAADGGVFTFGDAGFYGSTGAMHLNKPIVGMAATPDGRGYWLVAADGGVFTFGDAGFYGSTGAMHLNKPIVGMAATPDGKGYWLVAADGGVFTFGDARFYGSTGGMVLNKPVVGMASTPDGGGYWLVASDGGIFTFGDAGFHGSAGDLVLNRPVVGMASTPDGGGYWLVASDGGIFTYGDAPFLGSGAGDSSSGVVGMAAADVDPYPAGAVGYDVSWPQCGASLPAAGGTVSIVGVNAGASPYLAGVQDTEAWNPCFDEEAENAGPNLSVYVNVDNVAAEAATTTQGAQQIGVDDATADIDYVSGQGFHPLFWWLDVEAPCGYNGSNPALWLCGPGSGGTTANQALNAALIDGLVTTLEARGFHVGIYCTYLQWPATVGGSTPAGNLQFPGGAIWVAGAASASDLVSRCTDSSYRFAGGIPYLVQWAGGTGQYDNGTSFDEDRACV